MNKTLFILVLLTSKMFGILSTEEKLAYVEAAQKAFVKENDEGKLQGFQALFLKCMELEREIYIKNKAFDAIKTVLMEENAALKKKIEELETKNKQ